jgi:hypothetical protein
LQIGVGRTSSSYDREVARRDAELWSALSEALAAFERRERSGPRSCRKVFTVWPDNDGGWRVELEGGEGIFARFSTEHHAIRATRAFAAARRPSEVQVYDATGKLRAQYPYERDAPPEKQIGGGSSG